jgi:hypothetical protein
MFTVEPHGTIVLVRPLTDDVKRWLEENTAEDAVWFGGALVVEPRYLDDLYHGLVAEGWAPQ